MASVADGQAHFLVVFLLASYLIRSDRPIIVVYQE